MVMNTYNAFKPLSTTIIDKDIISYAFFVWGIGTVELELEDGGVGADAMVLQWHNKSEKIVVIMVITRKYKLPCISGFLLP